MTPLEIQFGASLKLVTIVSSAVGVIAVAITKVFE
jgi:hypothetical protein